MLLTRPPLDSPKATPFDLHALGTPPAFILSQDQTLHQDRLLPSSPLPITEKDRAVASQSPHTSLSARRASRTLARTHFHDSTGKVLHPLRRRSPDTRRKAARSSTGPPALAQYCADLRKSTQKVLARVGAWIHKLARRPLSMRRNSSEATP